MKFGKILYVWCFSNNFMLLLPELDLSLLWSLPRDLDLRVDGLLVIDRSRLCLLDCVEIISVTGGGVPKSKPMSSSDIFKG